MITPEDLVRGLMARVRRDFYRGRPEKMWFQQQDTVKKALTYPASELQKVGVELPAARYKAILEGILTTATQHGKLEEIKFPGAYLLHTVQEHWKHHGHEYYEEGKGMRNSLGVFMTALAGATAKSAGPDLTVRVLAQVHATLSVGKSKGRPKRELPPAQPDLFSVGKLARTPATSALKCQKVLKPLGDLASGKFQS